MKSTLNFAYHIVAGRHFVIAKCRGAYIPGWRSHPQCPWVSVITSNLGISAAAAMGELSEPLKVIIAISRLSDLSLIIAREQADVCCVPQWKEGSRVLVG